MLIAFNPMKYGERLRAARAHAGLTQPALANKVGMSQPNISNLENGEATGSEYTVQLAVACGVRPEWLAMEQGEMVDGLYVNDQKAKVVLMAMQKMEEYQKDMIVAASNTLAEQSKHSGTR